MSTFNFPHIRKRSCRPYPESGAETVEDMLQFLILLNHLVPVFFSGDIVV